MSDSGIKMTFNSFVSDQDGNRVQMPKEKQPKPEKSKKYHFFPVIPIETHKKS